MSWHNNKALTYEGFFYIPSLIITLDTRSWLRQSDPAADLVVRPDHPYQVKIMCAPADFS